MGKWENGKMGKMRKMGRMGKWGEWENGKRRYYSVCLGAFCCGK